MAAVEEIQAHGGIRLAELRRWGLSPEAVIDFSASVNPYGPSPLVRQALRDVPLDRYPDADSTRLVESLGELLRLPTEWIAPGNGATELIHAAARAWAGPDRPAAHSPPTFGEYAAAAEAAGAPVRRITIEAIAGPREDLQGVSLLYLCNPNNPTGELIPRDVLVDVLTAMQPSVVALDEAFINFVPGAPTALPLLESFGNLLIIRSMTKDYALTALRLGYAVGRPELIGALQAQLPPWSVNGLAQAAGVAALRDPTYLDVTLKKIRRAKDQLAQSLERQGWAVHRGEANFLLVDVGSGSQARLALGHRGLLVRDCASFGLPQYIRVAVRRPALNRRLLGALAELRAAGHFGHEDGSTIASIESEGPPDGR